MKKILILFAILFIATLSIGDIYKTTVDSDYGFYQVRNLNDMDRNVIFANKTLEIYDGDTIQWVNMANPEERLTIISDDNLWSNTTAILPWSFRLFNYTFEGVGVYTVHLQGYPRLYQKIIVKELYVSKLPIIYENNGKIINPANTFISGTTSNITINAITNPTSISIVLNNKSKKSPGFEIIIAIFGLILISRKL